MQSSAVVINHLKVLLTHWLISSDTDLLFWSRNL